MVFLRYFKVLFHDSEEDALAQLRHLFALDKDATVRASAGGGSSSNFAQQGNSSRPAIDNSADHTQSFAYASTVLYTNTKEEADRVAGFLRDRGAAAESYHAAKTPNQRTEIYERFLRNDTQIVCCTVAFGMGIDKKDVRRVVHYGSAKSLFHYIQQTGRGGRDGKNSECICLKKKRPMTKSWFLSRSRPMFMSLYVVRLTARSVFKSLCRKSDESKSKSRWNKITRSSS